MKTKYQEALDMYHRIVNEKSIIIDDSKHYKALQELVDKEKGVKPAFKMIWVTHKSFTKSYYCPNCNFQVSKSYHSVFTPNKNNYCPNCGTKIDWSDEE